MQTKLKNLQLSFQFPNTNEAEAELISKHGFVARSEIPHEIDFDQLAGHDRSMKVGRDDGWISSKPD